jgi:ATP/maltotriose-dependent transcriptional regulator MalT
MRIGIQTKRTAVNAQPVTLSPESERSEQEEGDERFGHSAHDAYPIDHGAGDQSEEHHAQDANHHLLSPCRALIDRLIHARRQCSQRATLASATGQSCRVSARVNVADVKMLIIARLARDRLSNPEIDSRLLISLRTVKYHLRKVFIKLGIGLQNELERVPQRPE